MIDVALRSLVFDRSKLIGSLAGVALATTLLLVEIGLYVGLLDSSAALVRHVGGDVWPAEPRFSTTPISSPPIRRSR